MNFIDKYSTETLIRVINYLACRQRATEFANAKNYRKENEVLSLVIKAQSRLQDIDLNCINDFSEYESNIPEIDYISLLFSIL